MTTNLTDLTNINGIGDVAQVAQTHTGGLFFGIIIIGIFFILTIRLSHRGIEKAIAASAYVCLLLSGTLVYYNYLQLIYPIIFLFLAAGSTFIAYRNQQP